MLGSSAKAAREIIEDISSDRKKQWDSAPNIRNVLPAIIGMRSQDQEVFMELLQNADDASATKIEFVLRGTKLYVIHNGTPFDRDDVDSICSLGNSTKKSGRHIGFMGIGFKAIFNIAKQPIIYSRSNRLAFSFSFDDETCIIPKWVEETPKIALKWLRRKKTVFEFELSAKASAERVGKTLTSRIDPYCLLLLNHTESIKVDVEGAVRRIKLNRPDDDDSLLEITERINEKTTKMTLLIKKIKRRIPRRDWESKRAEIIRRSNIKCTEIAFAFPIDRRNWTFLDSEKFNLYAFFPLVATPKIPFIIHADFETTTQRTSPHWDLEWNRWIFGEIVNALRSLILSFLIDDRFRTSTFATLPAQPVEDRLEELLFQPLFEAMKSGRTVPTSSGSLVHPTRSIIAPEWFISLFGAQAFRTKLKAILGREQAIHYVDPNSKNIAVVHERLSVENLCEGNPHDLLNITLNLTNAMPTTVGNMPPEWFELLYTSIVRLYRAHIGSLSFGTTKAEKKFRESVSESVFFLAGDNSLVNGGSIFLPSTKNRKWFENTSLPGLKLAHPETLARRSRRALREMGITEINPQKAINALLTSCRNDQWEHWTTTEMHQVLRFVLNYLHSGRDSRLRRDILEGVHPGVPVPVRVASKRNTWILSSGVYVDNVALRRIVSEVPVLDKTRLKHIGISSRTVANLLGILGVPRIRRVKLEPPLKYTRTGYSTLDWTYPKNFDSKKLNAYYKVLQKYGEIGSPHEDPTQWVLKEIHILEGFDEFVQRARKSELNHLFDMIKDNWNRYYSTFSKEQTRWKHYNWRSDTVTPYFVHQLRSRKWIPVGKNLFCPSNLIAPFPENKLVIGNTHSFFSRKVSRTDSFAIALGIHMKPTEEQLLNVLSILSDMGKVDDWNHLSRLLEVLSRTVSRTSWDYHAFPTTTGVFRNSEDLFWIDNPDYEGKLDSTGRIAWVPRLARPQKAKLFQFFRMKPITKAVTTKSSVILPNAPTRPDKKCTNRLRKIAPHVYSVLVHEHIDESKSLAIAEFFGNVTVERVDGWLEKEIEIEDETLRLQWDLDVDLEKNRILLSEDVKFLDSVATAVVDTLVVSDPMRDNLLGRIERIMTAGDEQAQMWMKRHGVDLVSLPSEQVQISEPPDVILQSAPPEGVTDASDVDAGSHELGVRVPRENEISHPPKFDSTIAVSTGESSRPSPLTPPSSSITRQGLRRGLTREYHGGAGPGRSPNAYEMGVAAEERVMAWETEQCGDGALQDFRNKKDKGYDFLSEREEGTRHIEVKGYYGATPALTAQEYCIALKLGDDYYLYIATEDGVYIIRNLVKQFDLERITIPDRWWERARLFPWNE